MGIKSPPLSRSQKKSSRCFLQEETARLRCIYLDKRYFPYPFQFKKLSSTPLMAHTAHDSVEWLLHVDDKDVARQTFNVATRKGVIAYLDTFHTLHRSFKVIERVHRA